MSDAESFEPKWFTSPLHYEEGLLLDRKQELYDLKRPEGRFKFVKHVIALANSARRLQRPARLLLGIFNNGEIRGLDDDFVKMREGKLSDTQVWEDKVIGELSKLLRNHVAPFEPLWEIKHGIVHDKLVAYILIEPVATHTPYRVKKAVGIKGTKEYAEVDDSFIRSGESSQKIANHLLFQHDWNSVGTYVLPRQWERYFETLLSTKAFSSVSQIAAYQDARLSTGQTLAASLEDFINGSQRLYILSGDAGVGKTTSVLHWMNTGIINALQTIKVVIKDEEFQLPPQAWIFVHYSLRNSDQISKEADLTDAIIEQVNTLGQFWASKPRTASMLLEEQQTRWLILLDGFDELPTDTAREKFRRSLCRFLDKYLGAKAIVTSRPMYAERNWNYSAGWILNTLAPFSPDQIHAYITHAHITASLSEQAAADLWQKIEQDFHLAQLSAYPSFLEALVTHLGSQAPNTLENLSDPVRYPSSELTVMVEPTDEQPDEQPVQAMGLMPITAQDLSLDYPIELRTSITPHDSEVATEVLRLGTLLNRAYRTLWYREQLRHGLNHLLAQERWDLTGDLALAASRHNDRVIMAYAKRIVKAKKALQWLLNLGIVREAINTRDQIEFMTILTQLYFSASKLDSVNRTPFRRVSTQDLKQVAPQHRELLQQIYFDITGESLHFDPL